MRIILKIISIFTIIAVATFLLANIANSIFGNKNPSLGKSFSVKKSKSFGGVILLSLIPEKENENLPQKINFLLLGNPGPGNNAPNLTDTIMLASLKPRDKKIYFLGDTAEIISDILKKCGIEETDEDLAEKIFGEKPKPLNTKNIFFLSCPY